MGGATHLKETEQWTNGLETSELLSKLETLSEMVKGEKIRTLKEATVKKYYYNTHEELKEHLYSFVDVYNCVKRLNALKALTVYDYIVKYWEKEPERFTIEPHHMFTGLNN